MYAGFVLLDLATVAFTVSMASCGVGSGDAAYVSEWIYQCKHSARLPMLPWIAFALFAAVVFWQLAWMYRVAREHEHGECAQYRSREASAGPMIFFSCLSVVGAFMVIQFEIHVDEHKYLHRIGVFAMTLGFFVALHIVWVILRTGDSNERLHDKRPSRVPFYMWFQYDLVFVLAIILFMVSAFVLTEIPQTVSVVAEYAALSLLFLQMFWLFLACRERERRASEGLQAYGETDRTPKTQGRVFLKCRARV